MAQGIDFLKLPAEVRYMIYRDVLHRENFPSGPQNYFSLTKVNRHIRRETNKMATKNSEEFTTRNQQLVLKSQRDQVAPNSSAYLALPPADRHVWPSNTIDLRAFALLRDVTLSFEEDEPVDIWTEDDAPWKRLCRELTSKSDRRKSPLLSILSKRVNFVELTNATLVTFSHRLRDERDIESLDIGTLFGSYCSIRLRSFHRVAAEEYLAAQALSPPVWSMPGVDDWELFAAVSCRFHVFRA